jgi:hypothetical protein
MIEIEGKKFKLEEITRLYPSAMIKTGYEDELTPISLEWVESQKDNPEVVVVKYAIFVHTKDKSILSFDYATREDLQIALDLLSKQI